MFLQNKYTKWYYNIIFNAKSRIVINTYTEKHHIIPKSLGGDNSPENIIDLSAREHFICHLLLPKMLTGKSKSKMVFALWLMSNADYSRFKERYKTKSSTYALIKEHYAREASALHTGKKVSASTKRKLSKSRIGKSYEQLYGSEMAKQVRDKISESRKGKRMTAENRSKFIENMKSVPPGMLGKHHDDTTKKKISLGQANRNPHVVTNEDRLRVSRQFKGCKQSEEHIRKRFEKTRTHGVQYKDKKSTIKKISDAAKRRKIIPCMHCNKEVDSSNYGRWHGDRCKHRISH